MESKCFAFKKGGCLALTVRCCPIDCAFYKSEQQFKKDKDRVSDRLKKLGYSEKAERVLKGMRGVKYD